MGKLIFALILFALGIGASRALASVAAAPSGPWQRAAPHLRLASRVVLAIGVVVPALVVLLSTFKVIPAGHVGVATLFGQVQPRALPEGLNFINPLLDVTLMSTQVQRRTARYDAASKDLQAVHVEMVLNYRLIPDRAPEVYQTDRPDYVRVCHHRPRGPGGAQGHHRRCTTRRRSSSAARSSRRTSRRSSPSWLAKYGIEMKEAALANIRFDPAYEKAIEAKQIEEQKAEQKRYELIQAQRQAEIVAAEAKGVADALRIKGEAEANYNGRVSSSLTPVLIQQQYLSRWDGRLPQYSLGGSAVPFIQIPGAPATEAPRR